MYKSTNLHKRYFLQNLLIFITLACRKQRDIAMPGGEKDKTADYPVDKDGNKLKPCCVCPETKRPRDECIMEKVRM